MKNSIEPCRRLLVSRIRTGLGACWLSTLLAGCAVDQPARQTAPPPAQPAVQAPALPPAEAPAATPLPVPTPSAPAATLPPAPPASRDKVSILRVWADQQGRLYRVAAPLLINNTQLCPRHVRNLLGFTAKTRYSYGDEFADAAQTALGLEEQLRIMSVLPGSSAEQAGLQKGDTLIAVEIEPLPKGPNAERDGARIISSELKGRSSINLTILRNGERSVLEIALTPACAMVIDLGNTDQVDSFADGQRVMVTRGMLDFVRSDQELAYVLAQEIARNILAQEPRPDIAAVIDRLHTLTADKPEAGAPPQIRPYSPDLAQRARRLSLYLLARAGYGIDDTLDFWNRLANHYAGNIGSGAATGPAPSVQERTILAETIGAIRTRQQLGEPLLPPSR